tara:strand:+ start:58783 stop:60864 length:2082 start_codon:yes stop_codon:yes gene_type:complete
MPINYEIKSQLAKLLATEDIIVENRSVPTAQFNVETRVLTLPMWKRASNSVYDMLVGHEVGHALYTPNEWEWENRIPHQFVNVVEDARIEKLMKRRYPGLAKSFYKGYGELAENDFFCIEDDDVGSMNLADRVNLHFKIGNFIDIEFSEEEEVIKNIINDVETFEETINAAEILYQYCKEYRPEVENSSQNNTPSSDKTETEQEKVKSQVSSLDTDSEESEELEQQTETETVESSVNPEPEVSTDDIFNERTQEFNGNDLGELNGYFDLPRIDLDTIIIDNKTVHEELNASWAEQIIPLKHGEKIIIGDFEVADKEYMEFKKTAQREVNYLVKEFECKKSADAYARASISKTGILDCTKLHTYKYNEDLFRKTISLPDGQNHGLIFLLDWSGSMATEMLNTVKQVFNLIWFCNKVNIPFDLYSFTNSYHNIVRTPLEEEDLNRFVVNEFRLVNLLTSGLRNQNLDEQMKSIWRIVYSFRKWVNYTVPAGYGLSGTPLNQSIACLYEMIPQFKAKHDLQKVQCVILTDGEANVLPVVRRRPTINSEIDKGLYSAYPTAINSYLRSRKNGHTYQLQYEYYQFTEILLEDLKRTFPDTNFIGFRLVDSRSIRGFISKYEDLGEKQIYNIKKEKFYAIKDSGYSSYFIMTTNSLNYDTDFDVETGATKAKIKSAFAKNLKAKALNKKVLSQFMDLVC